MAHLSRMACSRLERWRKRRRHASCMTSDFEKESVMRTKRARRWRRVLFQRSTWAVSPVSRAHGYVLLTRDYCWVCDPEIREAVTSTIDVWNVLPQLLARLFTPIPDRISYHLSRFTAQGNPNPGVVRFFEHK